MNTGDARNGVNSEGSENELSPLWQQIVEATSYGDGMTEMENDGESQLVKLYILDATYNACRSLSHWYD